MIGSMRASPGHAFLLALGLLAFAPAGSGESAPETPGAAADNDRSSVADGGIVLLPVDDAIGPATSDYFVRALEEADESGAQLVIVTHQAQDGDLAATVAAQFPKLTPISIDYGLMEKARRVLNIEATFDWDDVGSWISVAGYLEKVGSDNRVNTPVSEIDSENNIVFNARKGSHVALLGVDDLIIVQTEDALLIANRHQADAIKKLSDKLPPELL